MPNNITFINENENFSREQQQDIPVSSPVAMPTSVAVVPESGAARRRGGWTDDRELGLITAYLENRPSAVAHGQKTLAWERVIVHVNSIRSGNLPPLAVDAVKRKVRSLIDSKAPQFQQGPNDRLSGVHVDRSPLDAMIYQCWQSERAHREATNEQRRAETERLARLHQLEQNIVAASTYCRPLNGDLFPYLHPPHSRRRPRSPRPQTQEEVEVEGSGEDEDEEAEEEEAREEEQEENGNDRRQARRISYAMSNPWAATARLNQRIGDLARQNEEAHHAEAADRQRNHDELVAIMRTGNDHALKTATFLEDIVRRNQEADRRNQEYHRQTVELFQKTMESQNMMMSMMMQQMQRMPAPAVY
ncbi:hypothetical protein BC941DRAFT_476314 [Chlamydoabsidia padenii]|nr:hypothetical protein BC941DRAFT_476314 [Chlamydoabsidia padenii]